MADTKAPERIWADQDNLTWVEADPTERMKSDEVEYIRRDLHDALATQRDTASHNARHYADLCVTAEAERDAALAREAVVIEQTKRALAMGEAGYSVRLTPFDAQAALDSLLTEAEQRGYANAMEAERKDADQRISKARADAFEKAADMAANRGQQMFSQELRARINDAAGVHP